MPAPTTAAQRVTLDEVERRLGRVWPSRAHGALFDVYAFADYCGAVSDSKIVLAVAVGAGPIWIVEGVRRRVALREAFLRLLRGATARGLRVMFGQDHQYGIPEPLARELGLDVSDWRAAMRALFVDGAFAADAVSGQAASFARAVNAWLSKRKRRPYFWSATKPAYRLPRSSPRESADSTQRRLAELDVVLRSAPRETPHRQACPFSRVGDNGSVGGQTIVGMPNLLALVDAPDVDVRVWPFDGLALSELGEAHVAVEPYPSLYRNAGVVRSDANDAVACVAWAQRTDRAGRMSEVLDLRGLDRSAQARVRFEGWIAGVAAP